MTILVDDAIWPWRGGRWAHLVSDDNIAELHEFGRRLGLRRMAFQGDHYDVPEDVRAEALALGAEAVRGRDLVRRLRAAGLRLAAVDRPGRWEPTGTWPASGLIPDLATAAPAPLVEAFGRCVQADWVSASTAAFRRSSESAVVVEDGGGLALVGRLPEGVEARCSTGRVLELLVYEVRGS